MARAWRRRHHLGGRVRPVLGDAGLVGKGRWPAAAVRWDSNPPLDPLSGAGRRVKVRRPAGRAYLSCPPRAWGSRCHADPARTMGSGPVCSRMPSASRSSGARNGIGRAGLARPIGAVLEKLSGVYCCRSLSIRLWRMASSCSQPANGCDCWSSTPARPVTGCWSSIQMVITMAAG
jgi:hypothetical protein